LSCSSAAWTDRSEGIRLAMLVFIVSLLGHPATLLFYALHWSVGGHIETAALEILKDALPESGRAQMEALFAEAPEWTAWSSPDGTLNVDPRRLSQQGEGTDAPWLNPKSGEFQWILTVIIAVVLTYVGAYLYKIRIVDKRAPWRKWEENPTVSLAYKYNGGVWKYNCFAFFGNLDYCLYGLFCLGARLGDTYTATNIGPGYFTYVHAVVAVWLSGQLVGVLWKIIMPATETPELLSICSFVPHILLASWLAGQKRKLRVVMGDPSPEIRWTKDFCCYWWFPCCMAVQEGRQVDQISDTQTKCCFRLDDFELVDECGNIRRPGQPTGDSQKNSSKLPDVAPVVVGQPVGAPAAPVVLGTAGGVAAK